MSRPKIKKFRFYIPITEIKNSDGLFQVQRAGELLITATGRIAPSLEDMPMEFAERGEVKITIDFVEFENVNILPVFRLPDARPLLDMINRAAYNHLHTIYNQK